MEGAEKVSVFTAFDALNNGTEIPQNDIIANDSVGISSGIPDIKRVYMKAKNGELKQDSARSLALTSRSSSVASMLSRTTSTGASN